jgi:ATP-dependent exoDNAse (exonuclease V) beta subunit
MNKINIINASAGSGKTYRLTKLACENVTRGIRADRIFATTFTKKAAAELVERLRQRMLTSDKGDDINLLADGFVGTVNSVCARLLTEYAIDAGLSPAIDVIPEHDANKIFNVAVEETISKYADKLEPVSIRLSQSDWRETVNEIAKLSRDNCLSPDIINQSAQKSWESFCLMLGKSKPRDIDASLLFDAVKSAIQKLEELKEISKGSQTALETLKVIQKTDSEPQRLAWSVWAKLAKLPTPKDGEDAVAQVNEVASRWQKNRLFHDDVKTMIEGVFHCAGEAIKYYQTYKEQHAMMDFIDQETGVLKLLTDKNMYFRDSISERLSLLMVDEFQDTSPIQLAIFIELNKLCDKSFWVGDPKQSIFAFRGSDPILMNSAAEYFSKDADPKLNKSLTDSWRSRKALVDFSNAVFKNVFYEMKEKNVTLDIPSKRTDDAKGGVIESWLLDVKNKPAAFERLAIAIQSFLNSADGKKLKPKDIAVLCRINKDCAEVSASLENIGIRASTARGDLIRTPVCRLVLAAVRYLADKKDTLAMIELINFLPDYADYKDCLSKLISDHDGYLDELHSKPIFKNLDEQRDAMRYFTPLEVLEYAINATGVLDAAFSWPNTPLAMANLDKLRQTCVEYLDLCGVGRDAASLYGYLSYLNESDIPEAEGSDDQTIQVLTYHSAKGLEWPVVILFSLDNNFQGNAFNSCAKIEGDFNPQYPLNNRMLHFWPDPLPRNQTSNELDELLCNCPQQKEATERESKEGQRLLYVGMTRAKDTLILAVRRKTTKKHGAQLESAWLDDLTNVNGEALINLPVCNDDGQPVQTHTLTIGDSKIPITVREFTEQEEAATSKKIDATKRRPEYPKELPSHVPALITPSKEKLDEKELSKIKVSDYFTLGDRIKIKTTDDYASLGCAIHDFLALEQEQGKHNTNRWQTVAQRLLSNYGVDGVIATADMIEMHNRLTKFIETKKPQKIYREWPIILHDNDNQVMHGWIDMLLELKEGFVIIDHKTFPGANAEEEARKYAPQLNAYRRAVEAAVEVAGTNKKVLATLIHMPVLGKIFEVE